MNNRVVHNFCESRLNNNNPPELYNSYTSLFITITPLILGLPKNIIFFNISCLLMFNGLASFYYHYELNWIGKQADEMSMILSTYFGIYGLLLILYKKKRNRKILLGINNIYMILFLIFNTIIEFDIYFPFIFSIYIFFVLFLIYNISNKYSNNELNDNYVSYQKELLISFIGAFCWIISELYCNEYTKYGHIIWHLLFPLGFYKLILKYDKLLVLLN